MKHPEDENSHAIIEQAGFDFLFKEAFNTMQAAVNQTAHDKGWYESELLDFCHAHRPIMSDAQAEKIFNEIRGIEDARRLALMHSELSEGLEGLRHGNPPSDHIPEFSAIEEELADCIIRIMDVSQERGWKVAEALIAKAAFNQTRPHKHGGKKF